MFKRFSIVHWSHPGIPASRQFYLTSVLTGLVVAIVVTIFCGVVAGLWVMFTEQTSYHFSGVLGTSLLAGALLGGCAAGYYSRRLGWLHGSLAGLAYCLFLLVMTARSGLTVLEDPIFWARTLLVVITGALGGIVGVNYRARKERSVHVNKL